MRCRYKEICYHILSYLYPFVYVHTMWGANSLPKNSIFSIHLAVEALKRGGNAPIFLTPASLSGRWSDSKNRSVHAPIFYQFSVKFRSPSQAAGGSLGRP